MSIPDIFRSIGEGGFRTLETSILQQTIAAANRDTIIATGGGTPVFNHNMELMLGAGCVVYIRANIDRLLEQIAGSAAVRPLLNQAPGAAGKLEALLEQRSAIYECAHISLELEKIHTDTFAQILDQCTSRQS